MATVAQLEAQVQELTRRVNALASAMASLTPAKVSFLAGLSKLPSQTASNSGAGGHDNNTGSTWVTGERGYINNAIDAVNGVVQAMNNLQTNLKNNGFEFP